MPQSFLDYAKVFRFVVQVGAAAVPESVAGMARIFHSGELKGLADDYMQAGAGNPLAITSVGKADYSRGDAVVRFYWAAQVQIVHEPVHGSIARVNFSSE